jgi:chromosome segregation ATPase
MLCYAMLCYAMQCYTYDALVVAWHDSVLCCVLFNLLTSSVALSSSCLVNQPIFIDSLKTIQIDPLRLANNTKTQTQIQNTQVGRVVSLIEQVEGHMLKCKTTTKEAKSQNASLHTHEAAMRELERRCSEHETQLQYASDKLERLLAQKKIKYSAAEQALTSAKDELAALRAEQGDTETQAVKAEYEVRELRATLETQRNAHQVRASYSVMCYIFMCDT